MRDDNLWGEFPAVESIIPPVAILRAQANYLSHFAKQVIEGRISSFDPRTNSVNGLPVAFLLNEGFSDGLVGYEFDVVAPALNNFSYTITLIAHDIRLYPVYIIEREGQVYKCDNEEAFKARLSIILQSPMVRKVISGLLAQLKEI